MSIYFIFMAAIGLAICAFVIINGTAIRIAQRKSKQKLKKILTKAPDREPLDFDK